MAFRVEVHHATESSFP